MDQEKIQKEISDLRTQVLKQAKWLRWSMMGWTLVGTLALMGAAWQPGAMFFQDVKVRRLALVDANGVERLILDTDNRIVNIGGKVLKRGPQISGIILQNEFGDEVGGFGTSNCTGLERPCPRMTALMLDSYSNYTKHGVSERVGLFSREDGTAGLVFVDLNGKNRSMLTTDPNLNVSFTLNGPDETPRISGTVANDGNFDWSPKSK